MLLWNLRLLSTHQESRLDRHASFNTSKYYQANKKKCVQINTPRLKGHYLIYYCSGNYLIRYYEGLRTKVLHRRYEVEYIRDD